VVVVSISGGTYVSPYVNVVDYRATLLGGGATADTIYTLMGNMTSGATQEFPLVRPSMLLDAGCLLVDGYPVPLCWWAVLLSHHFLTVRWPLTSRWPLESAAVITTDSECFFNWFSMKLINSYHLLTVDRPLTVDLFC
jgi:hypothetical protein